MQINVEVAVLKLGLILAVAGFAAAYLLYPYALREREKNPIVNVYVGAIMVMVGGFGAAIASVLVMLFNAIFKLP